jgi:ABC-type cobalamin/Fe3+-siderophores transport system ATPase subunit
MSTVAIEKVGAISSIEFDLPSDSGGVKVFLGTSGSGKTTAIRCLNGLLGGDTSSLVKSDDAEKGEIHGLGRSVKIGSRKSTSGETEVPHLLDRLDVGLLVDPGIAKAESRTQHRIKALVSLGNVTMTPRELLGDSASELIQYIDMDAAKRASDPVEMAAIMAKSLNAEALATERDSDRKSTLAGAKRVEAGDVDQLSEIGDHSELAGKYRQAMEAVTKASNQKTAYESNIASNKQVDEQLAQLRASYSGPDYQTLETAVQTNQTVVDGLRARLAAAEASLKNAKDDLKTANDHRNQIARLEAAKVDVGLPVDDNAIVMLQKQADEAMRRLEGFQDTSRRKNALDESKSLQNEAAELSVKAEKLRKAAKQVMVDVQKALPEGPIQVDDKGVLVVQHGKRKKPVPYDDLSDGERWSVAMQYAVKAVGEGGVVPLRQESWQALDPNLRKAVAKQARDSRIWIVTAQVSEGPLRVEDFDAVEA